MSFPYSEAETYARAVVLPKEKDVIFKGNWLTKRALEQDRIQVDGGTQVEQLLEYAKADTSNYDGAYGTVNINYKQTFNKAILQWKYKEAHTTLTDADRVACNGAGKVMDIVEKRIAGLRKVLIDSIGTGVYSDGSTDTSDMNGLRQAVSTSNTYAGIAQSTYTWWAAAGVSTATAITDALLQTGYGAATQNATGQIAPTCGVTTQTQFDKIRAIYLPQQRYIGDAANVGWGQSIPFSGVPIVPDAKVPSGYFFWLQENDLNIYISEKLNFEFMPWKEPINQPSASTAFLKVAINMIQIPTGCYVFTSLT